MRFLKTVGFFSVFGLFLMGCATDRLIRGSEDSRSQEASLAGDEWSERLKAVEEAVSNLRGELASLHPEDPRGRPPISAFRLPEEVDLCGERIPLEDRRIWEEMDREFLVTLQNEAQVLLWMKRAKRYFPHIEKRLKELSLPDDLKYVTITESSLRPSAVSPTGASGIWQFIPSTGEKYGMVKDRGVDERFDFFKATDGALSYLQWLYQEFRSWTLAMAAYNAGENRVRREIEFQKMNSYFRLDLPPETERYVYRIAAAKIILSHPEQYGFQLENRDFYDPLLLDRIQIALAQPLPLIEVARAVGSYYKEIKEMNPHFSEEIIPAGVHFLHLPAGTSEAFWVFFSNWERGLECN